MFSVPVKSVKYGCLSFSALSAMFWQCSDSIHSDTHYFLITALKRDPVLIRREVEEKMSLKKLCYLPIIIVVIVFTSIGFGDWHIVRTQHFKKFFSTCSNVSSEVQFCDMSDFASEVQISQQQSKSRDCRLSLTFVLKLRQLCLTVS